MNEYETLYILKPDLGEDAVTAQVNKYAKIVTDAKGSVERTDKWGLKKLAYPIEFKTDGHYVLMTFKGKPSLPAELERQMKLASEVLRYIVIAKDERKSAAVVKKRVKHPAPTEEAVGE